ncbi:MAG: phage holin family protein [Anaerorhabdus sp.]
MKKLLYPLFGLTLIGLAIVGTYLFNFLAVCLIDYFFVEVTIANLEVKLVMALVLMLVTKFIKPILNLISLPLTLITFGLFSLVINAFVLHVTFSLVDGAVFTGDFLLLILISIIVSMCQALFK